MADLKWDIAERINKCGYDMVTALEMAQKLIDEFKASGKTEASYGIMNGAGKCSDVIVMKGTPKNWRTLWSAGTLSTTGRASALTGIKQPTP